MPLLAYLVVFFLFSCSFSLNLIALFLPKWLTHIITKPFYSETTFGLFSSCESLTGECRPFPRAENGDCEEEGFCQLWQAAGAGMILGAVVGILTIVALLCVMCSNREQRERGWMLVAGMLLLDAIPSLVSFSIIAYLHNTSSMFNSGTKYDQSFIMNAISWCISFILFLSILLASFIGNQDYPPYYYERID